MIPYWMNFSHWRYLLMHQLPGFFYRGLYGWAPVDTWSYDHYLCRTMAPALRHMAKKAHGYPPFITDNRPDLLDENNEEVFEKCLEAWKLWLVEKATWMEWYDAEELNLTPEMNDDQRIAAIDLYERQHNNFLENVMPDFCRHFESLWD